MFGPGSLLLRWWPGSALGVAGDVFLKKVASRYPRRNVSSNPTLQSCVMNSKKRPQPAPSYIIEARICLFIGVVDLSSGIHWAIEGTKKKK